MGLLGARCISERCGIPGLPGARPRAIGSGCVTGSGGIPCPSIGIIMPLGLGSTGRVTPNSLNEQLAMEEAMSNPGAGTRVPITMNDPRWPASAGWEKMQQNVNGNIIHYVMNAITGAVDDFKFK